jgi:RND family efflux transporter MFP subunit
MRRQRIQRWHLVSGGASGLILAVVYIAVCAATAARAETPLRLPVVAVELFADYETLSLTGEIVSRDEVGLSFPMGGRLLTISARKGDHVQAGQELARLESVQQEQALRETEAALEAAQADLSQAREDFLRQDESLKRGATTRISRDEAERRYRITQAGVEQARANLSRARKTYEDTVLQAPVDGVITDRLADPGEVVAGAHPILRLASGSGLDAIFDAPEVLPALGQMDTETVWLQLIDRPAVTFRGRVREVSPLVDPRKGTVQVKIGVDDPPDGVSYGDAVRGTARIALRPRIVVPAPALVGLGAGSAVWVLDPATGKVRLAPVSIHRFSDGNVILAEGLKPGDLVVAAGVQLLYPGRSVVAVDTGK